MSEQLDGQALESEFKREMGNALQVTWRLERRLLAVDAAGYSQESSSPGIESSLTITLDPRVVELHPIITIVAGHRIFRAVEIGDLDHGLFRTRRSPGDANQSL